MRFAVTAIIECELLSRFEYRLLARVRVSWGSAAYALKGADWVGAKRVTRDADDGVTAREDGGTGSLASVCVLCWMKSHGRCKQQAGRQAGSPKQAWISRLRDASM